MVIDQTKELPVMERFYTIQGEGAYQGHAAYFIRLAGCDVGCVWCDVKESWEAGMHPVIPIEQLVEEAMQYPGRLVVITGGEPLMYDLTVLTSRLKEEGFQINIETSGAYPLSGVIDWVCLSPKKFKEPVESIYAYANELKVIVFNKTDFAFAEKHADRVGEQCRLYLQTEWSKSQQNLPMIIEYVKEHPEWHVSLQTHKYMDIP